MNDENIRRQIEEGREHRDVGESAGLSDEDVVFLARRNAGGEGYLAEMARRQIKASGDLRTALETTSNRLYWLNVVLGLFTVALVILAVVAVLRAA